MPVDRLVFIIVAVIAAAAITVTVAPALVGSFDIPPMIGLAGLSIIALCASFIWRRVSDNAQRETDKN